ncbi:MAG: RusA family crossover junction endodeoxyribonuclease [Planctomycetes bacterium]|nr:RusA family crossover junction endodeoxyribonuclease [Planctomycetota bacterium]
MLEVRLPLPPTLNTYYRHVGPRVLISREGRRFRETVAGVLAAHGVRPMAGRLALAVLVRPPDRRRRDLDNVQKALLDALEKGGAYGDDSQIDLLLTRRGPPAAGGQTEVRLDEWPLVRCPLCGGPWGG